MRMLRTLQFFSHYQLSTEAIFDVFDITFDTVKQIIITDIFASNSNYYFYYLL